MSSELEFDNEIALRLAKDIPTPKCPRCEDHLRVISGGPFYPQLRCPRCEQVFHDEFWRNAVRVAVKRYRLDHPWKGLKV